MNLQNYIGYPIDFVEKELNKLDIQYKIVESRDIQKKFDTILVVNILQKTDFVEVVTDKFLLSI